MAGIGTQETAHLLDCDPRYWDRGYGRADVREVPRGNRIVVDGQSALVLANQ